MTPPWIRVHANLSTLKVVGRATNALGLVGARARVGPALAQSVSVGCLVNLWGQVSLNCTDGAIGGVTDMQLEQWAGWPGKPGVFAKFVREQHVTDGRINDWDEYQGALESQKAAHRERQRRYRAEKACRTQERDMPSTKTAHAEHVTSMSRSYDTDDTNKATNTASASPSASRAEPSGSADASLATPEPATKSSSRRPKPKLPVQAGGQTNGVEKPLAWLVESAVVWDAKFGEKTFPWGKAKKYLRRLKEYPPADVAVHLGAYLAATPVKFLRLDQFADTFGEWAPKPEEPLFDADGRPTAAMERLAFG